MATSLSGGGSRSTRKEPPTLGRQLVNFITWCSKSSALFCNLQSWARTHLSLSINYLKWSKKKPTYVHSGRSFLNNKTVIEWFVVSQIYIIWHYLSFIGQFSCKKKSEYPCYIYVNHKNNCIVIVCLICSPFLPCRNISVKGSK